MKYILSEEKINPFRPKPFLFVTTHDKNDLSFEKWKKSLENLKESGFGGFVLFNKPQNGFDADSYLSEEYFDMVKNAAKAAKELSLEMWINDGFDFPPGNVAGKIETIAPYLRQKRIMLQGDDVVIKNVEWGFPAFEEPESTELFIKLVYEAYKLKLKEYFGNPIVGFFSDTDNRRVNYEVMFDKKSPMRNYFPWSSNFEKTFYDVYGYDVMPYMKDILKRKDIPQAVDYWEHSGRLMQNWFVAHHKWLTENGLLYTGHTSDSSPFLYNNAPRSSCFTEGRFSDVERNFDYCGTDQELYALDGGKHMRAEKYYVPTVVWGKELKRQKMTGCLDVSEDLRAKQAASTAYLYGKKGVMCEMFAASNFGVEPKFLRQIAAFQIMQGVSFIVPHAYHYRFTGITKYFAPPDFSKNSMLDYSIRELNDELAGWTAMLSQGEQVCPIALIDPTEFVWRGLFNEKEYFNAFTILNRMPYGFNICDTDKLIKGEYSFKVAIAAGIELPLKTKTELLNKGITVLDFVDESALKKNLRCDIEYRGEGTPHFARRLIDGEEFTFIANIESDKPISGEISAYGKNKKITLYPGDIRYFSKNYDDFPEEYEYKTVSNLADIVDVEFTEKNLLPLDVFEVDGKPVLKTDDERLLEFNFKVLHNLSGLRLCIPFRKERAEVKTDGITLQSTIGKIFDEDYLFFGLPELKAGEHKIVIKKDYRFSFYERILIDGEFDVKVKVDSKKTRELMSFYNLTVLAPEKVKIELTKRRNKLSVNKSWALQGQPFYSGGVRYRFEIEAEKDGEYCLNLPEVRDVAELFVNNVFIDKAINPPYFYKFNLNKGKNVISITVYNSFANAMECYLEESGITGGIIIGKELN